MHLQLRCIHLQDIQNSSLILQVVNASKEHAES